MQAFSSRVDAPDIFIIRPQPESRPGFVLTGPTLPYPMWYLYEAHAIAYARHSGASRGGEVRVLDREGNIIRSEAIQRLLPADAPSH
jgi:hypothetical protein